MSDYLSELLSIQCEQAYGTAERLKDTGALSDETRKFLTAAQDVLMQIRDRFRIVRHDRRREATDGQEGQA